jgi:hypothetical protein
VLVFVGFLAHRYGDLAGGSGWSGSVGRPTRATAVLAVQLPFEDGNLMPQREDLDVFGAVADR